LNILIERYKAGDGAALNSLFEMFAPMIERHSEQIWYKIENQAEFECRCIRQIEKALQNFDTNRGKLKTLITGVIIKEKADYLARRTRKLVTMTMDKPLYIDKDGEEVEFEVADVLANVEADIIEQESVNEKAALLAKGDSRRMAILTAWSNGEFNDLELARALACSFGGKIDSHRTFIKRFRIECQERLANAL